MYSSSTIQTVLQSRNTLLDQMRDKFGYDVSDFVGASMADIDAMLAAHGQLNMLFAHTTKQVADIDNADGAATRSVRVPAERRVYVRYLVGPTPGKKQVADAVEDAFVTGVFSGTGVGSGTDNELSGATPVLGEEDTLVLVVVGGSEGGDAVTQFLVQEWSVRRRFVVIHDVRALKFNVLNHVLQPREIRVLTPAQKAELFAKYHLADDQMPEIGRFDPVAKVMCARPGQVIFFLRNSPTALEAPYYRIVV